MLAPFTSPSSASSAQLEAVGQTHPGLRRENNEDAFAVHPGLGLFVVADGMGGHAAGEVAARLAVDAVSEAFHEAETTWPPRARLRTRSVGATLVAAIHAANDRVFTAAQKGTGLRGMGTTLVAALALGGMVAIAHVGDSRAYLLRGRRLERLTEDHTLANAWCASGRLPRELLKLAGYGQALTRAVGSEATVDVDMRFVALCAGDVLLLCSDGLTNAVDEDEIAGILLAYHDLNLAAEQLIARANDNGGPDNVTVVLERTECA